MGYSNAIFRLDYVNGSDLQAEARQNEAAQERQRLADRIAELQARLATLEGETL